MDRMIEGQVSTSAADVYEAFFVPALFGAWAPRVADRARLESGQSVLDVACGTGVAAREAWRRIGPAGSASGVDCNDGMLAVAARLAPQIAWFPGRAESLPFEDAAFDAVTSQFGLMFFADRVAALAEMWRVLRPGGRLVVAVWASLADTPGYAAMVALLERLFGSEVAAGLRTPYALGATASLLALFVEAGISEPAIETVIGEARFPSIEGWVHTDVRGWTLADVIDDTRYALLIEQAQRDLASFVGSDGTVRFAAPAHIVSATRR